MRFSFAAMLLCVVSAGAQQPTTAGAVTPRASVVGAVIDSIDGGPLTNAIVLVAGTSNQAVVDSTGRFRIDSTPAGAYVFGLFHPLLDSIGVAITTKAIDLQPGLTTTITLATPSGPTVVALFCSAAERQRGAGVVIGHVVRPDSDDPVADATVRYTWLEIEIGKDIGMKRNMLTREAKVGTDGAFHICGIPPGTHGTVRASRGQAMTGEMPADLVRRPVALVTLRLDTLPRGTAVVSGRIVDDKGNPIPHADVSLAGLSWQTSSNDSGSFALRELPSGSQLVQVRKVGFAASDTAVVLSAQQPTRMTMTLHAAPPQLATVNVQSARLVALDKLGFNARRKMGLGHFLSGDAIANRGTTSFSDLARTVPGFTVGYTRSGQPVILQGRGASFGGRGCVLFLVDGFQFRDVPRGSIDGAVRPEDIIGVEFYQPNEAPAELMAQGGSSSCSLIVIWTRAKSIG